MMRAWVLSSSVRTGTNSTSSRFWPARRECALTAGQSFAFLKSQPRTIKTTAQQWTSARSLRSPLPPPQHSPHPRTSPLPPANRWLRLKAALPLKFPQATRSPRLGEAFNLNRPWLVRPRLRRRFAPQRFPSHQLEPPCLWAPLPGVEFPWEPFRQVRRSDK